MIFSEVRYRSRQFWSALRAKALTGAALVQVQAVLTPKQLELFNQLQPAEQLHAWRVLQAVQQQAQASADLRQAALLHDIGKSRVPLQIWERVLIVLARWLFPARLSVWGQGEPAGWRRAFVVAEQHPVWGAELATQAGCSALTVELIRLHQQPAPVGWQPEKARLLARLQAADDDS